MNGLPKSLSISMENDALNHDGSNKVDRAKKTGPKKTGPKKTGRKKAASPDDRWIRKILSVRCNRLRRKDADGRYDDNRVDPHSRECAFFPSTTQNKTMLYSLQTVRMRCLLALWTLVLSGCSSVPILPPAIPPVPPAAPTSATVGNTTLVAIAPPAPAKCG